MWGWLKMTSVLNHEYWWYVGTFLWNTLTIMHFFIEMWCQVRRIMLYTK